MQAAWSMLSTSGCSRIDDNVLAVKDRDGDTSREVGVDARLHAALCIAHTPYVGSDRVETFARFSSHDLLPMYEAACCAYGSTEV